MKHLELLIHLIVLMITAKIEDEEEEEKL
jgi:hypothetical protein